MERWFDATGSGIVELGIIVATLLGFCVAAVLLKQQSFLRQRARIPLVIGGWGTRGKSGSERKKAALLQALAVTRPMKTASRSAVRQLSNSICAR